MERSDFGPSHSPDTRLALGPDSAAIILRPNQPPQLLPDLLGCGTALLLFAPAVEAVRKMTVKTKEDEKKSQ